MTSILDGPFPGWEEEIETDLLGGIDDQCEGQALAFFSSLPDDDRELVQWYVSQGIELEEAIYYIDELVRGYAVIDPDRKAKGAIEMAQLEVQRVIRYFEIFLDATDFWPTICGFPQQLEDDSSGEIETTLIPGWTNASDSKGEIALDQDIVSESIMPYQERAISFLADSLGAPETFNQDLIIRTHIEMRVEEEQKQAEFLNE